MDSLVQARHKRVHAPCHEAQLRVRARVDIRVTNTKSDFVDQDAAATRGGREKQREARVRVGVRAEGGVKLRSEPRLGLGWGHGKGYIRAGLGSWEGVTPIAEVGAGVG